MKLNKILTSLVPITLVGTLVPIVSCNNTPSFTINYKDNINCLDPSQPNYHSLQEVQNAIKWKINIETEKKEVSVKALTDEGKTKDNWPQIFYYELIASCTMCSENPGIMIYDWTPFDQKLGIESFKIKTAMSSEILTVTNIEGYISYKNNNGKVYIWDPALTNVFVDSWFPSYTYQLCEAVA